MSVPVSQRRRGDAGWGVRASVWAQTEEQQEPTYARAIREVGLGPAMAVLDVGCGSGVFLRMAHEHGALPSGLDASDELLGLARDRVPDADLRAGDMEALPFEDDAFDVVCGFNSFFYAADMVTALREARRVAKPGARVVIQVWGRPERCALTAMKATVFPLGPPPPPGASQPPSLSDPGVLERIAMAAGLEPQDAFDHRYAFEYPDGDTLVHRMLGVAPVAAAADTAGEERVREAILSSLAPYRSTDGGYRLENEWHYLIATA